jgi:predicted acylesterase/phospholipase RssA
VTGTGPLRRREAGAEKLARAVREVVAKKTRFLQTSVLLRAKSMLRGISNRLYANSCSFECLMSKETSETVCQTNYSTLRSSDLLDSVMIWEICWATSAATSIIDPIVVGRFAEDFVDEGTGPNTPVWEAWEQA